MKPSLLALLRCPYCRGSFDLRSAARPALGEGDFGVLRCGCSAFPVVDGVPILQKAPVAMYENTSGATQVEGVAIADLVRLIESGRPLEALEECLSVPATLPPWIARVLPWRAAHGAAMGRLLRGMGKRRLRRCVLERRKTLGAKAILEHFFPPESPLGHAVGQYFILRFCQPRHLAALALLETLPSEEKPILDIACGLGHLEHYLTARARPSAAVGTDMNFFHAWIARHWFAPAAMYVCANAGEGLPFADDSFSATLCSDAYHYIPNRRNLLREMERCAPGGPVLLTRVGNQDVMPNEGRERGLDGYREEFAGAGPGLKVFGEDDLVRAYLARRNPFAMTVPTNVGSAKWLTFAWNIPELVAGAISVAEERPHAVGIIGLNPIYKRRAGPGGSLRLKFEFPLIWYAYENHGMLAYHPRSAEIGKAQLEGLREWSKDPGLTGLVDSFVLIGLPKFFDSAAPA